jgi:hypothetical protein
MQQKVIIRAVIALSMFVAMLFAAAPPESKSGEKAPRTGLDTSREPKAFRNVRWGATKAEAAAIIHFGESSCTDMSDFHPGETWCGSDFLMGNITATSNFVFVKDKLVQVIVSYYPSEFEYVKSVFVEKYGRPSSAAVVPIRTKAGVPYDNDMAVWKFPAVTIEMHRYGTTVERGATYFTLNSWIEEEKQRETESKKKAITSF